jgi:hypothetical protein
MPCAPNVGLNDALGIVVLSIALLIAPTARSGVADRECPANAIFVEVGVLSQKLVDSAGPGAVFCLEGGVHRAEPIRPHSKQEFHGIGRTVLNGSQPIAAFAHEGRYWMSTGLFRRFVKHGECGPNAPACDDPFAVFVDDRPLMKVLSNDAVGPGSFYVDYDAGQLFLGDDPTGHGVEVTVAPFAFDGMAADVVLSNIVIEKYASPAQRGAAHAREGTGWHIVDCEIRLNSGAGISVGSGTLVRNCNVHHNGQIGIEGHGIDITIEANEIWSNNIYDFDPAWEAGGVKLAKSTRAAFRGNHVHGNNGPGLWCDIECRNVVYDRNLVEGNLHIGIFHEISFAASIVNNTVRHNGTANRQWFWGADIVVAASQDVEVTGNTVTVAAGSCGIVLLDQGRKSNDGQLYKTSNNSITANALTFEGEVCAGGASDVSGDPAMEPIKNGNNRFNGNTYYALDAGAAARFPWGRAVLDWHEFRKAGQELTGQMVLP